MYLAPNKIDSIIKEALIFKVRNQLMAHLLLIKEPLIHFVVAVLLIDKKEINVKKYRLFLNNK